MVENNSSNKIRYAPSGQEIFYLPNYFNEADVKLKETSNIIPITGFNGESQAILIKPEAEVYIQTNIQCNARCPNCLLSYKGIPKSEGCLPFSRDFFRALEFASKHMNIHNCSVTGGEPTLFKNRLIKLFKILPKKFKNKNLFSNGAKLLEETSEKNTLLETLISNGLSSLVLNCIHPNEKIRAELISPLVTDKEYYEIVKICKNNRIDVRLSWVFDDKKSNTNKIKDKINSLIDFGTYLQISEIILRIPTPVINSESLESRQSNKLWQICGKYLDSRFLSKPKIVKRNVKTRAYYKINNMIFILEVYHEPEDMKTDAGTIMLFSGAKDNEVHMTYRWFNGLKNCKINYQGEPWASRDFFRQNKRGHDPYGKVIGKLK